MSEQINIQKPQGTSPHKVLEDTDRVSKFPNGRMRMVALFETVSQQIAIDIERAKAQDSKEAAIAIFEATYQEYQANKEAIVDKLDRLVRAP